jgi:hypothetical protein
VISVWCLHVKLVFVCYPLKVETLRIKKELLEEENRPKKIKPVKQPEMIRYNNQEARKWKINHGNGSGRQNTI